MKLDVKLGDQYHPVALLRHNGTCQLRIGEQCFDPVLTRERDACYQVTVNGQAHPVRVAAAGSMVYVHAFGRSWELELLDPVERAADAGQGGDLIVRAPMPGMVVEVQVAEGEVVTKGQPLLTIESMKLETVIQASRDGQVASVHSTVGAAFDRGALLITMTEGD